MLPVLEQFQEKQAADPDYLDVVEVFDTIQGEGPFAGRPATFIRLAGCNLGNTWCPNCDTDFTTGRKFWHVDTLVARAGASKLHLVGGRGSLVVVTGGEPFRQPVALARLVRELGYQGHEVQIETNGTICPEDFPWYSDVLTVVVSPKTPSIPLDMWCHADAVKYVVDAAAGVDTDGLPLTVLGGGARPARPDELVFERLWRAGAVYVQPAEGRTEEDSLANRNLAANTCLLNGYTLSLQLHKIVGLK